MHNSRLLRSLLTALLTLGLTIAAGTAAMTATAAVASAAPAKVTAQTGPAFKIGELFDVSCFSTATRATSCAVVGGTTSIDATSKPLSAFLTGTTWKVVSTV